MKIVCGPWELVHTETLSTHACFGLEYDGPAALLDCEGHWGPACENLALTYRATVTPFLSWATEKNLSTSWSHSSIWKEPYI